MRKLTVAALVVALVAGGPAMASTKVWKSGWGQGWSESSVGSKDGGSIYMACESYSGSAMGFTYSKNGKEYNYDEVPSFVIKVDDHPAIDVAYHKDRESANRMYSAIGQMRNGKQMTLTVGDVSSTFTLNKAHEVIPSVGEGCIVELDVKAE